jgi:3-oxoacyl-[acyl-carrier-protein] synthase II
MNETGKRLSIESRVSQQPQPTEKRRVVVTGFGAVTPLGMGAEQLLDRWCAGESGVVDGVGACSDFKPTEFFKNKEVKRYDRFAQLAIVAAQEALGQAGWLEDGAPVAPERIGCVMSTAEGGRAAVMSGWQEYCTFGPDGVSALFVPKAMKNASSSVLAMRYGIEGPAYAVVSACSGGADAIVAGMRMLRLGEVDAMVVGGSEASLLAPVLTAYRDMEVLSPEGVVRPFDARRDGFVMGEGAGVLVLEAAELAQARGATVIGEILGYGVTNDAFHLVAPHPEGLGAARAITLALEDAAVTPDQIHYVNAHGTGTPLNDRSETLALKQALGEHAHTTPISSLKSAIGHLLGGAGAVELGATLLALQRRIAPPTLNYAKPEDGLDLDYVPNQPRPLTTNGKRPIALSNSFGFGGHNNVLVAAGGDL